MDFKVGNHYSFSTLAPSVLGQSYSQLLLTGVANYQLASAFMNVDVKLATIAPYLGKKDTPYDATKDTYLIFKTDTGSRLVFGLTWINLSTVEEAASQVITAVIEGVAASDVQRIQQILALAGYNKTTITSANVGSN